ncbi:MAG: acetylxylan esterase [Verrucomicrobiae bacterium]|nr:acetylxylan esterase [Verrucomicrobiae bacterium]
MKQHIWKRSQAAFLAGDQTRDGIKTRKTLLQRQQAIRRYFINCLGGLPSSNSPLNPRTTGSIETKRFRIEKIIFESRPKHYVTANLYLPHGLTGKNPAVLFVCGHAENAKQYPTYQNVCHTLANAGLIVMAQDPVGQGERFSYCAPGSQQLAVSWGTREHDYAGAQCSLLGDSIARYFLHDAMRGIDYLCSRPEVDSRRIGVTGNSGGGTQTSMMMMADPRVAAAAPGTFIMNRETYMLSGGVQDAEQIWPGFTAAGFDHEDILLAMAPKPVRILAVTYDFFPIEGARRTVERCKRLWKLCGAAKNLDMVEDQSLHCYSPKLAQASAEFFCNHLLGKKLRLHHPVEILESPRLSCMKSGQVSKDIKGARYVYDANVSRLDELTARLRGQSAATRCRQAVAWLKKRVFKDRHPCPLNPRIYGTTLMGNLKVEEAVWWSQEGVMNHGILFRPDGNEYPLPVTMAVWDGGATELTAHQQWLQTECDRGRAALVLNVSGMGSIVPHNFTGTPPQGFYGTVHTLADNLTWLDDNLAALRVYDVIRALDLIPLWPGLSTEKTHLYAHGRHGFYAQLAGFLDRRAVRVRVEKGIGSFAQLVRSRFYDSYDIKALLIHGLLRHFDLPDLKRFCPGKFH